MDRSLWLSHLVATAALGATLAWGWSTLDPSVPADALAAAHRAWDVSTAVAHLGFIGTLAAAARWRARGHGGWRGLAAHAAALGYYLAATLAVWGGFGDAIHHFKRATGQWHGEFNGAAFVMFVAWPAALFVTAVTWGIAGRLGRR